MTAGPFNRLAADCHAANQHWWHDPATGIRLERDKRTLLFLIASEIVEAGEGERKDLMDSHLPHRKAAEVELADTLIRVFDYAGAYRLDLDRSLRDLGLHVNTDDRPLNAAAKLAALVAGAATEKSAMLFGLLRRVTAISTVAGDLIASDPGCAPDVRHFRVCRPARLRPRRRGRRKARLQRHARRSHRGGQARRRRQEVVTP